MLTSRINNVQSLISPTELQETIVCRPAISEFIRSQRQQISDILQGKDPRLLVVVGPCSIHDPQSAIEYAERLRSLQTQHQDTLLLVMRVYFEKPRTSLGWKGLIHDPSLDQQFDINQGLHIARGLLADINALGVPAACEFLDTIIPHYLLDFVSWGAIGARTSESQVHRQLASGLPMPIGFKNATTGNVHVAINGVRAASQAQRFISIDEHGVIKNYTTTGNPDCHVILRGGIHAPNYDALHVVAATTQLTQLGLPPYLMVDCSHGNCQQDYLQQATVVENLCQQIADGASAITGVMLESHLHAGKQDCTPGKPLRYGQSITDACLSWEQTVPLVEALANTINANRKVNTHA